MSDDLLAVAVELTARVGADGFRGDLAMANVSMALAALDGRDEVVKKDVEEAAMICLAHRRNPFQQPPPQTPPEPPEEQEDDDKQEPDEPQRDDEPEQDDSPEDDDEDGRDPPEPPDMQDFQQMLEDMVFEIGEQFRVIDYLGEGNVRIARTSSRKGRRAMAESADSSGRYCRSRIPDGKTHDLAFDATIRAAAPYQLSRDHAGLAIAIEPQDIREKVRERRSGCTILFLVDASGSLGARKRMTAVKGAVLSMLRDSYVKRDRVGMMAFRRDSAELILPPTRSVEYSYRKLEELPTGGKTPLSDALVTVGEFMNSYSRSHQGEMCYIVLISDGRGNVTFKEGSDPKEEALRIAEGLSIPQVRWIVIDAGLGYLRFDHAVKLAEALEGTYFRLEDLDADRLADSVRAAIRRFARSPG
jgi:magnesium chelatase subunit D